MTRPAMPGIAPFFIVRDVSAALAFYRDQLGFDVTFQEPEREPFFAIVCRDGAMLMMKRVGVEPLPNCKRHRDARWDAYVSVPEPDELATEFRSRNVVFSAPLEDTHDGLRGFELEDVDGHVLFFGRPRSSESSSVADRPVDGAAAAEIAKLQGTWKQVHYERDGIRAPVDEEQGWEPVTTFEGTTFVVTIADGSTPIRGTFALDPTKEPKAIDYTDPAGADAGKTFPAIYAIDGDCLVFCAAGSGRPRPTSFETKPGEVLRVHVRVRGG